LGFVVAFHGYRDGIPFIIILNNSPVLHNLLGICGLPGLRLSQKPLEHLARLALFGHEALQRLEFLLLFCSGAVSFSYIAFPHDIARVRAIRRRHLDLFAISFDYFDLWRRLVAVTILFNSQPQVSEHLVLQALELRLRLGVFFLLRALILLSPLSHLPRQVSLDHLRCTLSCKSRVHLLLFLFLALPLDLSLSLCVQLKLVSRVRGHFVGVVFNLSMLLGQLTQTLFRFHLS